MMRGGGCGCVGGWVGGSKHTAGTANDAWPVGQRLWVVHGVLLVSKPAAVIDHGSHSVRGWAQS